MDHGAVVQGYPKPTKLFQKLMEAFIFESFAKGEIGKIYLTTVEVDYCLRTTTPHHKYMWFSFSLISISEIGPLKCNGHLQKIRENNLPFLYNVR